MASILVVDDEQSMREFLSIMLRKEGYAVRAAASAEEALEWIGRELFSLVISDIKMPGMDGIALLREVRRISPETQVLMITAFGSTETAVEAMKQGAVDYVVKPFQVDEIKILIRNALERRRLEEENALLRRQVREQQGVERIVGRGPAMQRVFEVIRRTAATRSNVLITGESGTGKELVARAVHALSRRAEGPFVCVNCGALPENLLESELFGHVKGAFTGAVEHKKGLFEAADGGTLFLDEIGEMPLPMQVKLLRVLQDQAFRRVGGTDEVRVDVRVIAASNRDLRALVREGGFRQDLYYRLSVIPIEVPPLRERMEDLPLLVEHFLGKVSPDRPVSVAPDFLERLAAYSWPGNVRELENVIERAVVLTPAGRLTAEHLPPDLLDGRGAGGPVAVRLPEGGLHFEEVIASIEKDLLAQALERAGGVKKEAARILGMSFRSFRYRLAKYGIGTSEAERHPAP